MRILFIAPYAPSLVRVRTFHFVRGLVERGHRVTFAAPCADERERAELEALEEYGCKTLTTALPRRRSLGNLPAALLRGFPLQSNYAWSRRLARLLSEELEREAFDAVHIEHLRAARYGLRALKQLRRSTPAHADRTPVVYDSVDCIAKLFEESSLRSANRTVRRLTGFDAPRTRRYEARLMRAFDRVVTTTAAEAEAMQALAPDAAPPQPVANGVDLDYFSCPGDPRETQTVVLTGKMSYHANAEAARLLVRDVMPLVWARRPQTKVEIVGKAPSADVLELAYPGPASDGSPRGEVVVTGETPDLRPHLWRATVSVAPIVYGAGIQNKILEAMAASAPVVATANSASALDARPGHEILVGRTHAELADHILSLLDDHERRRRIGAAGRRYVERNHRWEHSAAQLETVYRQAAEVAAPSPQAAVA